MKIKLTFLFSIVLLCFFACDDSEPMDTCDTTGLTYTDDMADIINSTCASSGCHQMASSTTFEMHDFATVSAAVNNGRILGSLNWEAGFTAMPFGATEQYDQCTIDKFTAWINDGAPE